MPVLLEIEDGPAGAQWLSPAIVPGTLTGNSVTPALFSNNTLRKNSDYDFAITVRNVGDTAVTSTTSVATGPFITPILVNSPGLVNGPAGGPRAEIVNSPGGFQQLYLVEPGGNRRFLIDLKAANSVFFSPSGNVVTVNNFENGNFSLYFYSAKNIGSGSSQLSVAQLIHSEFITPSSAVTTFASLGVGFVPGYDIAFIAWSAASGMEIKLIDLRPIGTTMRAANKSLSANQVGQFKFSPTGDVLAVIGQPTQPIGLCEVPSLGQVDPWLQRGMGVPAVSVHATGATLTQVKPRGFEAIEVSSGGQMTKIDSPTHSLAAVAVYLWVDRSNTAFSTATARQYPSGSSSSSQDPSAYIDSIPARGSAQALVDANWRAIVLPAGEHYCALAEAYTTLGTTPADPRIRTGPILSLAVRQIAQHNIVVI